MPVLEQKRLFPKHCIFLKTRDFMSKLRCFSANLAENVRSMAEKTEKP